MKDFRKTNRFEQNRIDQHQNDIDLFKKDWNKLISEYEHMSFSLSRDFVCALEKKIEAILRLYNADGVSPLACYTLLQKGFIIKDAEDVLWIIRFYNKFLMRIF